MRKGEKLQATDEQRERIEARRNALDWSTGDDSDALIEAARVLIFGSSNGDLPARITEERITRKELCVRAKYNKWKINEQIEKSELERSDIDQLIGDRILVPQGISYRSWKDFRGQKDLDKRAFKAYWVALGLSLEDLGLPRQKSTKLDCLYDEILTLNHNKQLEKLYLIGWQESKFGAFLINNQCQPSRAWLMWRLDREIYSRLSRNKNIVRHSPFNLISTDLDKITNNITEKLNRFAMGDYNLIITIDHVDKLDQYQFRQLLQELDNWKKGIQGSTNFCILYLIDRETANNWRKERTLYEQMILPTLCTLNATDLSTTLMRIHSSLGKPPKKDLALLAKDFVTCKKTGKTPLFLENIYSYFQCDLQGETRWFNYP